MKARNLIGRRTGQCVVRKETIRIACDGTDVFDDYWTDSEIESRSGNESTFIKRMHTISTVSVRSNESFKLKDPSFSVTRKSIGRKQRFNLSKALSNVSSIPENDSLTIETNESLELCGEEQVDDEKPHKTLRDLSIQTSQVYNTPITEKITPKRNSTLRKRISFNKTKFGTAKSTKGERNRSFAGEKTWLDKSINTSNLSNKEQSIQTSDRYSSPRSQRKKAISTNSIVEATISRNNLDDQRAFCNPSSMKKSPTYDNEKENHPKMSQANVTFTVLTPNNTKKVLPSVQIVNEEISDVKILECAKIDDELVQKENSLADVCNISGLQENHANALKLKHQFSFSSKRSSSKMSESSQNTMQTDDHPYVNFQEGAIDEPNDSLKLKSPTLDENHKDPHNLEVILPSENEMEKSVTLMQGNLSQTKYEGQSNYEEHCTTRVSTAEYLTVEPANHSGKEDITESLLDSVHKKGKKRKRVEDSEDKFIVNAGEYPDGRGSRRSGRTRIPPLAFWRNERRVFRNTESGNVTCLRIEEGTEEDCKPLEIVSKKQKTRRRTSKMHGHESLKENDQIWYRRFGKINWSKPFAQRDGKEAYIIGKTLSDQDKSFGYIEIGAKRKKEEQYSPVFSIYFTIMKGQVEFSINKTVLKLKTCDNVIVPADVPYSIYNPGAKKALISFSTQKQPFFEDQHK